MANHYFPKYGNDNDDVDLIGVNIVELFYNEFVPNG